MTQNSFRRVAMSLVACSALALTACGGEAAPAANAADDFSGVENGAKSEGQLVWYTSLPDETADAVIAAFNEKYGMSTEKVRLSSSLLTARVSTELSSGQINADVVTAADPAFFEDAVSQKWLQGLTDNDLPSLDAWPADYLRQDQYALINIQPAAIAFNPDKVDEEDVDTWEELTDPKLQGQIFFTDPTKVPTWLALVKVLHDEYGDDYVRDLGKNLQFVDSLVPGAQSLAAGSGTVLAPSLVAVTDPLAAQGAPIESVFPDVTTGVEQFSAALRGSQHPNSAMLFVNFLLSEEGQTILNKGSGSSPLGDLPGTIPLPSGYVSPDIAGATAEQATLTQLLGM